MCALLYPAQVFVQCHWPWHHHLTLHSSHNWREKEHGQQEMPGWKVHPGTAHREAKHSHVAAAVSSITDVMTIGNISTRNAQRTLPPNRLFSTSHYVCFVFQVLQSFSTVQNKPVWQVKRKLQFFPVNRYVYQPSSLNPSPPKQVPSTNWSQMGFMSFQEEWHIWFIIIPTQCQCSLNVLLLALYHLWKFCLFRFSILVWLPVIGPQIIHSVTMSVQWR